MNFYRLFVAAEEQEFPLELERKALNIALERWPREQITDCV